jgi:hypothetical protein
MLLAWHIISGIAHLSASSCEEFYLDLAADCSSRCQVIQWYHETIELIGWELVNFDILAKSGLHHVASDLFTVGSRQSRYNSFILAYYS